MARQGKEVGVKDDRFAKLLERCNQYKSPELFLLAEITAQQALDSLNDAEFAQVLGDYFAKVPGGAVALLAYNAELRLKRSAGGLVTEKDRDEFVAEGPKCPKCGHEMYFRSGLGKPDFYQCGSLECGYVQNL